MGEKWNFVAIYMLAPARIPYAQKWKEVLTPTMKERNEKMMELAEREKLAALIRDKNGNSFVVT